MTGIGGDAFALFYEAGAKKITAVNGSGRSAASATLEDICSDLKVFDPIFGTIPVTSPFSVTVPGGGSVGRRGREVWLG